jgi:hypothetical protein
MNFVIYQLNLIFTILSEIKCKIISLMIIKSSQTKEIFQEESLKRELAITFPRSEN